MALFSNDARTMFYGTILVIIAVIFLLSSLGLFKTASYIVSPTFDLVIAFILLIFGLAFVFSNVGKAK